jgi:hypothetical protein
VKSFGFEKNEGTNAATPTGELLFRALYFEAKLDEAEDSRWTLR